MRRQLTLFLPPDQRTVADATRQRLDPQQRALIQGHVTLCRDAELTPWQAIDQRLASLGEVSISMRFGGPQVLADGCVLLRPTRGDQQYQDLRRSILGPSTDVQGATSPCCIHAMRPASPAARPTSHLRLLASWLPLAHSRSLSSTARGRAWYHRSMGLPSKDSSEPNTQRGYLIHSLDHSVRTKTTRVGFEHCPRKSLRRRAWLVGLMAGYRRSTRQIRGRSNTSTSAPCPSPMLTDAASS